MTAVLRRGVLAGLAGAAAMAAFLLVVGEPIIGDAVALEDHGPGHAEMFGRGVQQAGGVVGTLLVGAAYGAIFAVVFAATRHRLPGRDDWERAVRLAAVGFVAVFLVPFLKYPANPPAVGDPATVGERTVLWLLALAWSVTATWLGWRAARALADRGLDPSSRLPVAAAVWAAVVATALVLLPADPDPAAVPAELLWRFRMATAGGALCLWAVTGAVFGRLSVGARRGRGALVDP